MSFENTRLRAQNIGDINVRGMPLGERIATVSEGIGIAATERVCQVIRLVTPGSVADRAARLSDASAERTQERAQYRSDLALSLHTVDRRLGVGNSLRSLPIRRGRGSDGRTYWAEHRRGRHNQNVSNQRLFEMATPGWRDPEEPHNERVALKEREFAEKVDGLSRVVFEPVPTPAEKAARTEEAARTWIEATDKELTANPPGNPSLLLGVVSNILNYDIPGNPMEHRSFQEKLQTALANVPADVNLGTATEPKMVSRKEFLKHELGQFKAPGSGRQINSEIFADLIAKADKPPADFKAHLALLDGPDKPIESPSGNDQPRISKITKRETFLTIGEEKFAYELADAETKRGEALMDAYLRDGHDQLSGDEKRVVSHVVVDLQKSHGTGTFQERLEAAMTRVDGMDHLSRADIIAGLNKLKDTTGPKRAKHDSRPGDIPMDIPEKEELMKPRLAKGVDAKLTGVGDMFEEFLKLPPKAADAYLAKVEKPFGRGWKANKAVADLKKDYVKKNFEQGHALSHGGADKVRWDIVNDSSLNDREKGEQLKAVRITMGKQRTIDRYEERLERKIDGIDLRGRRLLEKEFARRDLTRRLTKKHKDYRTKYPDFTPDYGPWKRGNRWDDAPTGGIWFDVPDFARRKHRSYRSKHPKYGPGYGPWTKGVPYNDNPLSRSGGNLYDVPAAARRTQVKVRNKVNNAKSINRQVGVALKTELSRSIKLEMARRRRRLAGRADRK